MAEDGAGQRRDREGTVQDRVPEWGTGLGVALQPQPVG